MTIGRFTTTEEVDYVVSTLKDRVAKLRELSAAVGDVQRDGVDISAIQWTAH
jgi:cysteine desulfurase